MPKQLWPKNASEREKAAQRLIDGGAIQGDPDAKRTVGGAGIPIFHASFVVLLTLVTAFALLLVLDLANQGPFYGWLTRRMR